MHIRHTFHRAIQMGAYRAGLIGELAIAEGQLAALAIAKSRPWPVTL